MAITELSLFIFMRESQLELCVKISRDGSKLDILGMYGVVESSKVVSRRSGSLEFLEPMMSLLELNFE